MQVIETKSKREKVRKVKGLIKSAGNQLFAVSFVKRSDGTKRNMVCRSHVRKTQYAGIPSGKRTYDPQKHDLAILFDMNTLKYSRKDKLNGRGGWKSIPLDSITRIKVGGEIYKIIS
jgi:hypothetical protein